MSRRTALIAVMITLFALPVAAQTVDEILAKNIQARGGAEKLAAIQSRKMTGRVVLPGGFELGYTQINKRPDKVREEYALQGMSIIQSYDGSNGWQIDPTQGKKTAEPLGEEDLRGLLDDAAFDGTLIGYKERGATVELLGKEDVDGSPAYKLRVKEKNGDVKTVYLDEDAMLEIKVEIKRMIRGAERESEVSIGDYKATDGVMLAHSLESKPKGAQQGQKLTIERVEDNPKIDDAFFVEPTGTPSPSANQTSGQPEAQKQPLAKAPSKTKTNPPAKR
jgi:outer membrane lipoprotein-sorting protein